MVKRAQRRRGGTLAEVLISSFIAGILIVPSLAMLANTAGSYEDSRKRDRAFLLANDLLTEMLALPFEDESVALRTFGPESDEGKSTRADFDDVDDYHDWKSDAAQRKDGTIIDGSADFQRAVIVEFVSPDDLKVSNSETTLKKISVTVSFGEKSTSVTALRCKTGMHNSIGTEGQSFSKSISFEADLEGQPTLQFSASPFNPIVNGE